MLYSALQVDTGIAICIHSLKEHELKNVHKMNCSCIHKMHSVSRLARVFNTPSHMHVYTHVRTYAHMRIEYRADGILEKTKKQ